MGKPVDLSIIIVAYNVKDLVKKCLGYVKNSADTSAKEVVFVDNGSSDGTSEMIEAEFPEVRIVRSENNLGFGRANNLGHQEAGGRYVLLLNCDAFIGENTLQRTVDFMEKNPGCGILGCSIVDAKGHLRPSAMNFKTPWRHFVTHLGISCRLPHSAFFRGIDDMRWDRKYVYETDWVPGCFMLIRKSAIDDLEFFFREDFFMYSDDADICLRAKRKGWKVVCYPEDVVHIGGESSRRIEEMMGARDMVLKHMAESDFIYFRKNYNFFYAAEHLFLTVLMDMAQIIIKLVKGKGVSSIADNLKHLKIACKTAINTNFGRAGTH